MGVENKAVSLGTCKETILNNILEYYAKWNKIFFFTHHIFTFVSTSCFMLILIPDFT